MAERFHDPETTISYFENLNKEKEKEKVNSSIRKTKATKSKKPEKQQATNINDNLEQIKEERLTNLLQMELIFEEFSELLLSFLIKREKDNMSLKEIDLTEKMAGLINKIIKNLNQKQLKSSKN